MNKTKTLLSATMMACSAFAASALDITLNIDNADHVRVAVAGIEKTDIVTGANTLTIDDYTQIGVSGVAPWEVASATDENGTAAGYIYNGEWSIYPSSYDSSHTYNITTVNPDDARDGSFTLIVDAPEKVNVTRANRPLTLTSGNNTVKFNTQTETTLNITPANYMVPLHSVTVNGEPATMQGNSAIVTLTDGCTVEIVANIPEKDVAVTFSFADEDVTDAITATLDGTPATITNGTIAGRSGQILELSFDNAYNITDIKVNGNSTNVYGFRTALLDDTAIEITGHKFGTISAKIIVSEPDAVTIYNGYSHYDSPVVEISADGTVELSENNSTISWKANTGCKIESVTLNGQAVMNGNATLAEGDVVNIEVTKITMDRTAVFFTDIAPKSIPYFQLQANDELRTVVELEQGYNVVPFYSGMTEMAFNFYDPENRPCALYHNGTLVDTSSNGCRFDLNDGDVVKIYFNGKPAEAAVNLTVAPGIEAEVKADHITPVESGTHNVHTGTIFTVKGENIEVTVDGAPVAADSEGTYKITVTGNHNIEVKAIESAISTIESPAQGAVIFDLQGRRLAAPARGINIVNGRKLLVK